MEYRYPPLYKYIAFFVIFYLFIRHYKQLTQDKYLIIAVFATLLIALLDYMLIFDHPNILSNENFDSNDSNDSNDLDDILDDGKANKDSAKSIQLTGQAKAICRSCSAPQLPEMPKLVPISQYDDFGDDYLDYDARQMQY
jgi:hypothetical protein